MKNILETGRLLLRKFTLNDAKFILTLVNTPSWLEYIGDRKIHSIEDAHTYLKSGPMDSYSKNGFGLYAVVLKENNTLIGMCGLLKRDSLEDIDLGFALLPKYVNRGYAFEIASATLNYAKTILKIERVVAVTDTHNAPSIKLLNKLGLQFEKTINLHINNSVLLFVPKKQ